MRRYFACSENKFRITLDKDINYSFINPNKKIYQNTVCLLLTEPTFKRCSKKGRTKNSTHFCVFQPNRVIFRKFQKLKSSSIEGFNFSWEFGGIISDSSL